MALTPTVFPLLQIHSPAHDGKSLTNMKKMHPEAKVLVSKPTSSTKGPRF